VPFVLAWVQPLDVAATPSLLATNTHIVTAGAEQPITARDRSDGTIVWTAPVSNVRAMAVHGGLLLTAGDGALRAFDETTGSERWAIAAGEDVRGLAIDESSVFFADGETVRAVRVADGTVLWQQPLSARAAHAVVAGERIVLVALEHGRLQAFDAASGATRWRAQLDATPVALAISDTHVLFGLPQLSICTLAYESGETGWCFRSLTIPLAGPPIVTAETAYVVLMDNTLRLLARDNGDMQRIEQLRNRPAGGPRLAGGMVVVPMLTGEFLLLGSDGRLARLDPPQPERVQTLHGAAVTPDGSMLASITVAVDGSRRLAAFQLKRPEAATPQSQAPAGASGPPDVSPTLPATRPAVPAPPSGPAK
jgi:hypothetical protein